MTHIQNRLIGREKEKLKTCLLPLHYDYTMECNWTFAHITPNSKFPENSEGLISRKSQDKYLSTVSGHIFDAKI